MATSGSTNLSLNGNELIYAMFRELGIYSPSETPEAVDVNTARQKVNLMLKTWQADRIGLWLKKRCLLFLQPGQESYDLGATGDPCIAVSAYVQTTLDEDAASGAVSIAVDSIAGMADNYALGVELDDGSIQWTAVNGTPSGSTVAFDDALTDDASSGNYVYAYVTTAQIARPVEVLNARHRNSSESEIGCTFISEGAYLALPDKSSQGTPLNLYYDPQLTNGVLYMWPTADTARATLRLTVKREIEDIDAITDDPDCPKEWLLPIIYNGAVELIPQYGVKVTANKQLLIGLAQDYKKKLKRFDNEPVGIKFAPGRRR